MEIAEIERLVKGTKIRTFENKKHALQNGFQLVTHKLVFEESLRSKGRGYLTYEQIKNPNRSKLRGIF